MTQRDSTHRDPPLSAAGSVWGVRYTRAAETDELGCFDWSTARISLPARPGPRTSARWFMIGRGSHADYVWMRRRVNLMLSKWFLAQRSGYVRTLLGGGNDLRANKTQSCEKAECVLCSWHTGLSRCTRCYDRERVVRSSQGAVVFLRFLGLRSNTVLTRNDTHPFRVTGLEYVRYHTHCYIIH